MDNLQKELVLYKHHLEISDLYVRNIQTTSKMIPKRSDIHETTGRYAGRILFLCDENGRKLVGWLSSVLSIFQTQTIIKRGANFTSIICDLQNLTINFTEKYYIIIFAGKMILVIVRVPIFE